MDDADAACATEVKAGDPDRFLSALFAPAANRANLMAVYAFNLEVARTRDAVTTPMLGEIRLQWWREAVAEIYAGRPRRHPVCEALARAVTSAELPQAPFDALIEARSFDLYTDPMPTLNALRAYARKTQSAVFALACAVLVPERADDAMLGAAADAAGIAYAFSGLVRRAARDAAQGHIYLPTDLLAAHGATREEVVARRPSQGVVRALRALGAEARAARKEAVVALSRAHAPSALPAFLPLVLVPARLKPLPVARDGRWREPPPISVFRRQLSLLRAALRGRP